MTLFISRQLTADSPLLAWADEGGHEVVARSLIDFAPVDFIAPEAADWWFFYSSRAVEFGLRSGIPQAKLAALGAGTAKTLRSVAGRVDFTGTGQPEEVAAYFGEVAAGERVFFPRARQSRKTVQCLLADKITVLDAICYDNVAVPVTEPVSADVYVFTSPLNVSAYLDFWALHAGARVVAIGPSTAAALEARGVECLVASRPDETGVLSLIVG